ncbi:MAG: AAA family ATPase [Planctomycetota bacterium]
MKIDRLDLIRFGHLSDVSLDFSSDGADPPPMEIVYGDNESGKSTSLRAIGDWLFGFPHQTNDDFLHPMKQLRIGGRLRDPLGQTLDCIRRKGRLHTLRDGNDDQPIDPSTWQHFLGQLDRATFETRFGLSHEELLRGGEQILRGEGELGELLFAAGAGISRLREVQADLTQETTDLFRPRGKSAIGDLIQHVKEAKQQLASAQVQPAKYMALQTKLAEQEQNLQQLRDRSRELTRQHTALRTRQASLPLVPRWRIVTEELADVAGAPHLDADFTSRVRQWQHDHLAVSQQSESLQQQHQQLRQQLDACGEADAVLLHPDEIDAAYRGLPIRENALSEHVSLSAALEECQRRIRDLIRDLSVETHVRDGDESGPFIESLRITESTRQRIQSLAQAYEKHVAQRDDAAEALSMIEAQIASLDTRDGSGGSIQVDAADVATLSRAIESAGRPENMLQELDQCAAAVEASVQKSERLHQQLNISLDIEATVQLKLPNEFEIKRIAVALANAQQATEKAAAAADQASTELDTANEVVTRITSQTELPTSDSLAASRKKRDRLLERIEISSVTEESLSQLAQAIRHADAIADSIVTHQKEIHARSVAHTNVDIATQRVQRSQQELQSRQADLDDVQTEWRKLLQLHRIPHGSPEAVGHWLRDHQALVAAWQQRQQDQCTERLHDQRLQHIVESLHQAIIPFRSLISASEPIEDEARIPKALIQWFHQITGLRDRMQSTLNQQLRLDEERKRLTKEAQEARQRWNVRSEVLERWQSEWESATKGVSGDDSRHPQAVLPMLDTIGKLTVIQREADGIRAQIAQIDRDNDAYLERVGRLRSRLEKSTPNSARDASSLTSLRSVVPLVEQWHERLQQARIDAAKRDELRRQWQRVESEQQATQQQQSSLKSVQRQLCTEAGCESIEQIEPIQEKSRRHIVALAKRDDLVAQLAPLSGGQPIEEFVESINDIEPADVLHELNLLEQQRERLDVETRDTQHAVWCVQQELSHIDGGDNAARISQSIEGTLGTLQTESERYARLKLASTILHRAIEHYREQHQGPVLQRAQQMFQVLTNGRYIGLAVDLDEDGRTTLKGRRGDQLVPASAMSSGTADSLYFSLRLASLQHQLSSRAPVPLIVDDCLIQMDDARAAAALRVLASITSTTQVILFTHHQHLLELAATTLEPNGFRIHRLGQPERPASKAKKAKTRRTTTTTGRKKATRPKSNRAADYEGNGASQSDPEQPTPAHQQTSLW